MGRAVALTLDFGPMTNIQPFPPLPRFPTGQRRGNDATTSRTIACSQIHDEKATFKNSQREVRLGHRPRDRRPPAIGPGTLATGCPTRPQQLPRSTSPHFPISAREVPVEATQVIHPEELAAKPQEKNSLQKTRKGKRTNKHFSPLTCSPLINHRRPMYKCLAILFRCITIQCPFVP
jgi:hypothetical protein